MQNNNNDISHSGVLGMRWGVRRKSKTSEPSTHTAKAPAKKNVKDMSDEELKKIVNRLNMEKQYRQLSNEKVSKGKDFVQKAIKTGATVATVSTTALTIYGNAGKIKDIMSKTAKK